MKKFVVLTVIFVIIQLIGFIILGNSITNAVRLYVNSDYNRYSLHQHSTYRADKYILDHKTGRVWTEYAQEKGNNYWLEMDVINSAPTFDDSNKDE